MRRLVLTRERAKKLRDHCHEQAIRMDQARKDGKMIADLHTTKDIYNILTEILSEMSVQ